MSELAVLDKQETSLQQTPMSVVQWAIANNATVEQMEKLYELQQRVEADGARKAFHKAFSNFKAESITVLKNVAVTDGPLKGKRYADLFGVVSAVIPALSKHGLSHAWKLTRDEPSWMEVTCTITHSQGHSESVSMGAAPDTGPGRNAIQARGSAKSYLERYTLLAATGLAATDTDDDGKGSAPTPGHLMPEPELVAALDNISAATTRDELKRAFNAPYKRAQELKDKNAQADIIAAKNKRLESL